MGGGCVHMLHTYNIIFRSRYIHSTCTWKEMRSEGKHLHLNSSIPEERAFFLNSSITCDFFK